MTKLSSQITAAQVSLSNLPERTKAVDDVVLKIVEASTGIVGSTAATGVDNAWAIASKDANGVYFLDFNVTLTNAGGTAHMGFRFTGVTLAAEVQSFYGGPIAALHGLSYYNGGVDDYFRVQATSNVAEFTAYGRVKLSGKPSWFDANREAGFSVAAQIESATDTTLGLVKTFNTTLTNTGVVGDYEEVTVELVNDGAANINGTIVFVRIGRLVTMGFDEPSGLTHDSVTSASTSAGVIPSGWEPGGDRRNTGQALPSPNDQFHVLTVGANGSINCRYLNSSLAAVSKLGMGQQLITWIIGA